MSEQTNSRAAECWLEILLDRQQLLLLQDDSCRARWSISSARKGAGETNGSGKTPRGRHHVRLRIGEGLPINAVFVARRPTGEVWTPALSRANPNRDWILTRILWLSGDEPGVNRGGQCDTLRRFIYIHGTPDSQPMGRPESHGCIRMHGGDLLELFDHCFNGMRVEIREHTPLTRFCARDAL